MKYTVGGLQQDRIVAMGFDTADVEILRWVIDFYQTQKMCHKIINFRIYFWVAYQKVIDELPVLKIKNKRVIARRFDNYVKKGLMNKTVVKGDDLYLHTGKQCKRHGTFTYFSFHPERLAALLGPSKESDCA